jgi:microsomal dipeptidase-like Zn-dependent dipeptidase
MIDPCIWQSEDFSKLSILAKVVWIGLFSNADDEGRGRAKASYVKSMIFPYDEDEKAIKKVDKTLDEIAQIMSIIFYIEDGNELYQLRNWGKFQTIDKPKNSVLSPCSDKSAIIRRQIDDASPIDSRQIDDASRKSPPNRREENIKENKEKGSKGGVGGTPTPATPDGAGDPVVAFVKNEVKDAKLQQALLDFLRHRKNIKKPVKDKMAVEKIIDRLRKLADGKTATAVEIINNSIANGWQGLFALDEKETKKQKGVMNYDED